MIIESDLHNAHKVCKDLLRLAIDYDYMVSDYVIHALGIAVEVLEEKLNKLDIGDKDEK